MFTFEDFSLIGKAIKNDFCKLLSKKKEKNIVVKKVVNKKIKSSGFSNDEINYSLKTMRGIAAKRKAELNKPNVDYLKEIEKEIKDINKSYETQSQTTSGCLNVPPQSISIGQYLQQKFKQQGYDEKKSKDIASKLLDDMDNI